MCFISGEGAFMWNSFVSRLSEYYGIYVVFVFFLDICIEDDTVFILAVVIRCGTSLLWLVGLDLGQGL